LSLLICLALVGFFDDRRRITKIGRLAVLNAKRRRDIRQRDIRQEELADLAAISRPTLANILAGRFGTSQEVAERIGRIVLTTPEHERQPFLPGLAA
jgi:transcriptional regulator with XRE-family HTH domain